MKSDNTYNVVITVAALSLVMALYTLYLIYTKPFHKKPPQKLASIVRLVGPTGHTYCSGTVVTKNIIVTAAHCLVQETPLGYMLNDQPIGIREDDNKELNVYGKAIFATSQMDQGIIQGDFSRFEQRSFSTDIQGTLSLRDKQNSQIISCGYPLGGDLFCTILHYQHQDNFMWSNQGLLLPGMSGGPAMIDGVVVGVNVAVSSESAIISPIYNLNKEF